jgi:hypothetical protein
MPLVNVVTVFYFQIVSIHWIPPSLSLVSLGDKMPLRAATQPDSVKVQGLIAKPSRMPTLSPYVVRRPYYDWSFWAVSVKYIENKLAGGR